MDRRAGATDRESTVSGVPDRPVDPSLGRRLLTIDLGRGLAALAVLAAHGRLVGAGGWREDPFLVLEALFKYGYLGVPAFVIISGFCIHRRWALRAAAGDRSRPSWRAFWKRRVKRLYPTYLAAIGLALGLAAVHGRYDWGGLGPDLVTHLVMVHNLHPEYSKGLANPPMWSLGMEEQLYLLYVPLLVLLTTSTRLSLAAAAVVTVGWRVAFVAGVFPPDCPLGSWTTWPFAFWLHWALGAVAVEAWAGVRQLPAFASSLTLAAALCLVAGFLNRTPLEYLHESRLGDAAWVEFLYMRRWDCNVLCDPLFAVAFWCVLNRTLAWEQGGGPARLGVAAKAVAGAFAWVGLISYSVYLAHSPVYAVLDSVFDRYLPIVDRPRAWPVYFLVYTACGIVSGWLLFLAVERHSVTARRSGGSPLPECPPGSAAG
ncbi:acyltransferase family protein [Alienimonas chondri]|uniref:Acyltransferase 3 domain-containing protein n=1 Tax=Alienimonas chondri TaxID=2681879 RepID=A0ABX1VJ00_9PLAN|nr:hypothetical protein [Alienimonas chondri]